LIRRFRQANVPAVAANYRPKLPSWATSRCYEQKMLANLTATFGLTPAEAFARVIREGNTAYAEASVVVQAMAAADERTFYRQPWVMVASDSRFRTFRFPA